MFRLFLLSLLLTTPLFANTPKLQGQHKNWLHQSCTQNDKRVDYIVTTPTESKGQYKKRGEVSLIVTREGKKDVVNFVAGYSCKPKSTVKLRFDNGKTFTLFTADDRAWAQDEKSDSEIVNHLKKRSSLTITGISSRGTKTEDKISLAGFSAAYNAMK